MEKEYEKFVALEHKEQTEFKALLEKIVGYAIVIQENGIERSTHPFKNKVCAESYATFVNWQLRDGGYAYVNPVREAV